MSPRPVSEVKTIEKGKPDDILISCISFEGRCINVANHLSDDYKAKISLIINYLPEHIGGRKEKNQDLICTKLLPHHVEDQNSITPKTFDKNNPYSFWYFLEDWSKDIKNCENITIDITTFTKSYLLILLKFLRKRFPESALRVLYTKGIYPKNESITWGIKDITILSNFGVNKIDKKNSLLVILLGYEDDRAHGIWEFVDPLKTIAIIGIPPTYIGAEKPSKKFNESILEHPDTIIYEVSAIDPLGIKDKLNELYNKKEYEDLSFFIAPLGTKMQVVGVYIFFEEVSGFDSRAQIIYAYPAKYNEKKYTLDYEKDKVWEFFIKI